MSIIEKISPDWSWGPGSSPATGAVVTAAGSLAGATAAAAIGSPWLGVAAGGALVSMTAAAFAAYREQPFRVIGYRAGAWLAGTAWATTSVALVNAEHAWGSGPWSPYAAAVLGGGTMVAASIGAWLARRQRKEEEMALAKIDVPVAYADDEDGLCAEWEARMRKVTRRLVAVRNIEMWETGRGFTLDCDLPTDGTTVGDIKSFELPLASAAGLMVGCNVEVLASDAGRGAFRVRVATSDALIEDQIMPDDYSPTRIADPISLGVQTDGAEQTIIVNYATTAAVGQKDSGKSNTLDVITTGVARTNDADIFAIDTSGEGRYMRPWVRDWVEGRAGRPAIDWAAPTDQEARIMCRSLLQMIKRTATYQARLHQENSNKIIPAPDLPAIILIVDEFGKLPDDVKDMIVEISDTGRGAAVSVVGCALRAKAPYFSRDFIAQSRNRIGMRVTDEGELQMLFDAMWSRGRFDPSSMPYPGVGVCSAGATTAVGFKAWMLDPVRISAVARAVADHRPSLDAATAALGEAVDFEVKGMDPVRMTDVYSKRWERTLPIMFPDTAGVTPQRTAPSPRQAVSNIAVKEVEAPVKDLSESEADMARAVAAAREAARAADEEYAAEMVGSTTPEAVAEIAELNELFHLSPDVDPRALPEGRPGVSVGARERMMQLILEAGLEGTGASRLTAQLRAEGYSTARQTAMGWLAEEVARGTVTQPGGNGKPYVHRDAS